jgi:hypothetical protein
MAMAEKQGAHREALEARVINGNVANQTRGSYFAFILSLVAIIGGFVLIEQGKDAEGLAAIITSVAGLGRLFLFKARAEKGTDRKSQRIAGAQDLPLNRSAPDYPLQSLSRLCSLRDCVESPLSPRRASACIANACGSDF